MERKRTKQYRAIDLDSGDVWDFRSAQAVADHIWIYGPIPLSCWAIYKDGVRWRRRTGGEVNAYARALERWNP